PLLPGREATVLVAAPQIAHDLGDLLHIAGGELLDIGLVPTRPVGGLLGVGLTEDLEHLVQALLVHHVAHADQVDVVGGDLDGQVALGDPQLQIGAVFALDGASLDLFDECSTMVRVDDGLADGKVHVDGPLSAEQSSRGGLCYHSRSVVPAPSPCPLVRPGHRRVPSRAAPSVRGVRVRYPDRALPERLAAMSGIEQEPSVRRTRRLVLSVAALGLALGASGCAYTNPVQTHEFYQSSDGTNA